MSSYVEELRSLIGVGHRPLALSGTGIVVWRRNSLKELEVLLQLRSDHNKLGLLGGGIELGERYENCALRELREEAALLFDKADLKLLHVYAGPEHISIHPNGDVVYHTIVLYSVEYSTGRALGTPISSETQKLVWKTQDNLNKLLKHAEINFFHNNIPIIRDIVKGKFF